MPIKSKSKNLQSSTFFIKSIGMLQKQEQSKTDNEYLTDFINAIVDYFYLHKIACVNLYFINVNDSFRYLHPRIYNLGKMRKNMIKQLLAKNILLYSLVDKTKLPYNGCKLTKIRRKKQKRVTKYRTILVSSAKN